MKARVWFHRISAFVWLGLLAPALVWWPNSVAFVIIASIYANMKSDWSASEAADDRRVLDRIDELERVVLEALGGREERRDPRTDSDTHTAAD